MQSQWSHTGTVCKGVALFLLLIVHTGAIAAGQPASQEGSLGTPPNTRTFSTGFVSLSPGHTISTSLFIFSEENTFEIKIPGVDYQEPSGAYTRDGLMFVAEFSATVLKQKKHYRYTFSAKGISLFENYIGGIMVLEESIKETGQRQAVKFVFWGTAEDAGTEENKSLFPF